MKKYCFIGLIFFMTGCTAVKQNNLVIQSYNGAFEKNAAILEKNVLKCYKFNSNSFDEGIKIFFNKSKSNKSIKISFHHKGFGFLEKEPFSYILLNKMDMKSRIVIKDTQFDCLFAEGCKTLKLKENINHWFNNKKGCLNEKSD